MSAQIIDLDSARDRKELTNSVRRLAERSIPWRLCSHPPSDQLDDAIRRALIRAIFAEAEK